MPIRGVRNVPGSFERGMSLAWRPLLTGKLTLGRPCCPVVWIVECLSNLISQAVDQVSESRRQSLAAANGTLGSFEQWPGQQKNLGASFAEET